MTIYSPSGDALLDVLPDDDSQRSRQIMGDDQVTLKYSLVDHLELPVYSYIEFQGERYTLWRAQDFVKNSTRDHAYTVTFGSAQYLLKRIKYKFLSETPYELKFPITAKPSVMIQILVDNLNLVDSGWAVGDVLDAPDKTFSINHEYCYDVLQRIAGDEGWSTEWEIDGKTVNFRKVEYNKDAPLALSYGKGNGLRPGIKRQTQGDKAPATVLYIQGGTRNISYAAYGSQSLLLPKGQQLTYNDHTYKVDADGMYITRADRELTVHNEDSYDASDIYPSRVGTVSSVVTVDASTNLYDFIDSSIPADLDYTACLIAGQTMTVIFQTGQLAGREFDVKYIHADRRFQIVPAEQDGYNMPADGFLPSVGDTYAVFGIQLPDAYIRDDATQSGASWDMFREAVRYLASAEEEQFSFTGDLSGLFAKGNWLEIGGKIRPGGYVSFTDPQFQTTPVLIRITGVTDNINNPYKPKIDLSNAAVGGYLGSTLGKLKGDEVTIDKAQQSAIDYAKRRWRDTQELADALSKSLLNFTGAINPITVHAMMMYLGDESLQYMWVADDTSLTEIGHTFTYDKDTQVFSSPAGKICHMTLGIDTLAPSHDPSEYKRWDIAAYTSPALSGQGALWLYLKCSKTDNTGTMLLSATAIGLEDVAGYYHFLCGFLNSEYDGDRSWVTLYGFTEITPGAMRVNKVISVDGSQYFDMLNRRFKIGNADSFLSYNVDVANGLMLKGTMVQSPSGDTDHLGVDRGNWVADTTYYPGDIVKYSDGNVYKCLVANNGLPTNTANWRLMVSKGDKGDTGNTGSPGANGQPGTNGQPGQGYLYAYYPSNSLTPPAAPTSSGVVPSGWWSYPNFNGYNYIYVSQSIQTNGVWGSWSSPKLYSMMPVKGDPGPGLVFRGLWSEIQGSVFYNNAARRDVIKAVWSSSTVFYIYKGADATVASVPFDDSQWENFGADFSSVATDLLLAVNANVGGWIFKNERLESQSGGMFLDGVNGKIASNSSGNQIVIDSSTRRVSLLDGSGRDMAYLTFANDDLNNPEAWLRLISRNGDELIYDMIIRAHGIEVDREGTEVAYFGTGGFRLDIANLPTSGLNLGAGSVYRNGNQLMIVTP